MYAILKEGIMGNILVKLYEIWTVIQKEMSFKDISYLEPGSPIVQWTRTFCAMLEEGTMTNNPVKLF